MDSVETQPTPHVHRCAARPPIHSPGRESPANKDDMGRFASFFDPQACTCLKPEEPQCCANHPTANPDYVPHRDRAINQLQGFATEIRDLKELAANQAGDVADLKAQVARLTSEVAKLGAMRVA